MASEIASSMVYKNSPTDGYQELVEAHLREMPSA
jgi:hypothetical protein